MPFMKRLFHFIDIHVQRQHSSIWLKCGCRRRRSVSTGTFTKTSGHFQKTKTPCNKLYRMHLINDQWLEEVRPQSLLSLSSIALKHMLHSHYKQSHGVNLHSGQMENCPLISFFSTVLFAWRRKMEMETENTAFLGIFFHFESTKHTQKVVYAGLGIFSLHTLHVSFCSYF